MSELLSSIKESMKTAMRAKQKERLNAIRMLLAQIKQVEVDQRLEVTETDILAIIDKMIKQRRDSIAQFEAASRNELAEIEKIEVIALQEFLPQALSDAEISNLIDTALRSSGATSMKDMSKVMAILKPQVQGRGDLGTISKLIKSKLN